MWTNSVDGKEDPRVLHAGLLKGGTTEMGRVMDHRRFQLDLDSVWRNHEDEMGISQVNRRLRISRA